MVLPSGICWKGVSPASSSSQKILSLHLGFPAAPSCLLVASGCLLPVISSGPFQGQQLCVGEEAFDAHSIRLRCVHTCPRIRGREEPALWCNYNRAVTGLLQAAGQAVTFPYPGPGRAGGGLRVHIGGAVIHQMNLKARRSTLGSQSPDGDSEQRWGVSGGPS